jgi:hypothetical protein
MFPAATIGTVSPAPRDTRLDAQHQNGGFWVALVADSAC